MAEEEKKATALYEIVKKLADNELLKPDPITVAIERLEHEVVYPCGRLGDKLNLNQLEWANDNKKTWFIPDIKTLWIELNEDVKPTNLTDIKKHVKDIAENAGFNIKFKHI